VRQMRQTRRRGEADAHEGGRRAGTAPEAGASGEAVAASRGVRYGNDYDNIWVFLAVGLAQNQCRAPHGYCFFFSFFFLQHFLHKLCAHVLLKNYAHNLLYT
jgi:hypothetical protein